MEKLDFKNNFFIWNSDEDKKDDKSNKVYYDDDDEVWNDPMFDHGIGYCFHKWKIYVGFTEVYRYCTKCNLKSET